LIRKESRSKLTISICRIEGGGSAIFTLHSLLRVVFSTLRGAGERPRRSGAESRTFSRQRKVRDPHENG
jgi:hypothetical protein